jgi:hypothetical protein
MKVALDVGAFRIRSLELQERRLLAKSSRSAYAVLPDHDQQRWLLERAQVPFSRCEGHLILVGDNVLRVAESFSVPLRPLLVGGKLPPHDPLARQILASLIERHLPPHADRDAACCVILPSGADLSCETAEFIQRTVRLHGFCPVVLSAAEALVLAELESHAFTGIALVFGASGSEMVLAHNGRPLVRAATAIGGDWLDEQFAASQRNILWSTDGRPLLDIEAARRARDNAAIAGDGATQTLLRNLSLDLVNRLLGAAGEVLGRDSVVREFSQPLAVLVGGGLASAHGFVPLVAEALAHADWPIATASEIRAIESPNAIPRGGLVHAELDWSEEAAPPVAA